MTAPDPTETFRQEAQELLESLEQLLLDLERSPGDTDLIDGAFRALHTIKGSGAMFGFDAVAAFTHHVETAFDLVRKGKVASSRELIAVALAAKDQMRILIERPGAAAKPIGDAILRDLQKIVEAPAAAAAAAAGGTATWRIRFRLPQNVMAMGTNPLLLLDELRGLGAATVTAHTAEIPPLVELDPTACHISWDVVLSTEHPRSAIEDVFLFVIDDMELKIEPVQGDGASKRLGEILVERGDVKTEAVDSALAQQEPLGKLLVKAGEISTDGLAAALAEQQHLSAEARATKSAESIRVPAARLDELMDRVGELVIAQSRLKQVGAASADPHVKSVAEEIERLVMELRDTTMGIRMVPIGSLFGRFRRLIHDLARDLDKDIDFTTSGEETELDKTVVERLNDPLVHLIRNAVDHGLENRAARSAAGKPSQGRIALSARHAGAEVLISIVDDGRGLDRARIQARAEEQGLLPPGAKLPDSELFEVLFPAGLLDCGAGHQPLRPRRRHGCGQADHRSPARHHRCREQSRPRHRADAAPAADPRHHRRPPGPRRQGALRHPAGRGRGMRRVER